MKRIRIGSLGPARMPALVMVLAALAIAGCGDENPFGPDSGYGLVYLEAPPRAAERTLLPPVVVAIRDVEGNTALWAEIPVTIALAANPGGATLSGTLTVDAVGGIAIFDDLAIDRPGSGYSFAVTAGELPAAESAPFDVAFVSALAVGYLHACVVRAGGTAYCWGYNGYGQLGDGTTATRTAPVPVSGDLAFSSVAPGALHTCGLTPVGEAYCWGLNNFGQVGDSTTTYRNAPVPVVGGRAFSSIGAGIDHSCGVEASTADAYCWGRSEYGQRGDGTASTMTFPVLTFGASLLGFERVSAGGRHTCGIAQDGAAVCWGRNNQGQLGDGTTTTRWVPTAVSGGLSFAYLAVNNNDLAWETSCGVTPDGAAYCWGLNNYGQLGRGTTGAQFDEPEKVFGGLRFTSVSPGTSHTCGVTTDGDAYCWGSNNRGQLGNGVAGATEGTNTPTLVTGGHVFRYVGAGRDFSCGLTESGDVYCWGYNGNGQLGDGTTTDRSEPVLVLDLPVGIGG